MEPLQRKNVLCKILSLILTQRVLTLQEMHRYFIVYEYLTTTQKKRRHLLYLSRMVQQRGFRQINRHRVWAWPRPQNWFRLLLGSCDMDLLWKMHFHVTRPTFNALCDSVRGVLKLRGVSRAIHFDFFWIDFSSRQNVYLSWHRSAWLSVGFPFPIGQVRSQVWCWPYLAAYFGFFELRTFPWSLSKVQVGRFYPFTLKVGSKCTWLILTSSSVKPTIMAQARSTRFR